MPTFAIIGASRGIGFGFVRQISKNKNNIVFALVRDKQKAIDLQKLIQSCSDGNVFAIQGDLDDHKSLKAAASEISNQTGGRLDFLIINGAMFIHERSSLTIDSFPDEDILENDLMQFFKTNAVGTTHAINAFMPLIKEGTSKKVIAISTGVSSPQYVVASQFSSNVAYSVSKAALNMVIAKFAVTIKDVVFLAVTPGFVKTLQGPEEEVNAKYAAATEQLRKANPAFVGPVSIDEAVQELLVLFDGVTAAQSGQFLRRDGKEGGISDIQPQTGSS